MSDYPYHRTKEETLETKVEMKRITINDESSQRVVGGYYSKTPSLLFKVSDIKDFNVSPRMPDVHVDHLEQKGYPTIDVDVKKGNSKVVNLANVDVADIETYSKTVSIELRLHTEHCLYTHYREPNEERVFIKKVDVLDWTFVDGGDDE